MSKAHQQQEQKQQDEAQQPSPPRSSAEIDALVARASQSSKTLDEKWEEFQNLFKKMNESFARAMTNGGVGQMIAGMGAGAGSTGGGGTAPAPTKPPLYPLKSFDLAGVGDLLRRAEKIVVLTGAGVSASVLPDFRSKETGIYAQIEKRNLGSVLQRPEDFFSMRFLREHPDLFYSLAGDLKFFPKAGEKPIQPTLCHEFIAELHRQGKLLGEITQNIDGLSTRAGIPPEKLLECHGTFARAFCIGTDKHTCPIQHVWEAVAKREVPLCKTCNSVVRPDVVFFGEPLASDYVTRKDNLMAECDCLIVMGTSLQVMPVAAVPAMAPENVNRVLINRDPVGLDTFYFPPSDPEKVKEMSDQKRANMRDIALLGDCQEVARQLLSELGRKVPPPTSSSVRGCAAASTHHGSTTTTMTTTRRSPSTRTPPRAPVAAAPPATNSATKTISRTPPRSPVIRAAAAGTTTTSMAAAVRGASRSPSNRSPSNRSPSNRSPANRSPSTRSPARSSNATHSRHHHRAGTAGAPASLPSMTTPSVVGNKPK